MNVIKCSVPRITYTIQPCKMKFWSNCFCYVYTARFLRKQTLRESTSKLFARNNTLIVWRMRFQQIAEHASNTDICFSFQPIHTWIYENHLFRCCIRWALMFAAIIVMWTAFRRIAMISFGFAEIIMAKIKIRTKNEIRANVCTFN